MGCGSSKSRVAVAPAPMQPGSAQPQFRSENGSQTTVQHNGETVERQSSSTSIGSKKSVKIRQNKALPKVANKPLSSASSVIKVQEAEVHNQSSNESDSSQYSSRESVLITTRLVSAYSTQSKGSQDSGLGEEYAHIITEGSDSATKEVANLPEGMEAPNLTIEGEKVKTPSLVGHRKRLPPIQPVKSRASSSSESSSPPPPSSLASAKRVTFTKDLEELPDSPNIIKRPCSRGGLAFDIVLDESAADPAIRRKPIHLKKLEQKRGAVSHEELDEKQRTAEIRRKEQSQMLLERLRAKQEKDRQVAEALAKFAAMQAEIKNGVNKKIEETTEKREAYLKAMRDRLREKSQRVEEVKTAKKMDKENSIPSPQTVTVAN